MRSRSHVHGEVWDVSTSARDVYTWPFVIKLFLQAHQSFPHFIRAIETLHPAPIERNSSEEAAALSQPGGESQGPLRACRKRISAVITSTAGSQAATETAGHSVRPQRGTMREGEEAEAPAASKAPSLPWMRVPISIQQGTGVALADVGGLAPALATALRSRECFVPLPCMHARPMRSSPTHLHTGIPSSHPHPPLTSRTGLQGAVPSAGGGLEGNIWRP